MLPPLCSRILVQFACCAAGSVRQLHAHGSSGFSNGLKNSTLLSRAETRAYSKHGVLQGGRFEEKGLPSPISGGQPKSLFSLALVRSLARLTPLPTALPALVLPSLEHAFNHRTPPPQYRPLSPRSRVANIFPSKGTSDDRRQPSTLLSAPPASRPPLSSPDALHEHFSLCDFTCPNAFSTTPLVLKLENQNRVDLPIRYIPTFLCPPALLLPSLKVDTT